MYTRCDNAVNARARWVRMSGRARLNMARAQRQRRVEREKGPRRAARNEEAQEVASCKQHVVALYARRIILSHEKKNTKRNK